MLKIMIKLLCKPEKIIAKELEMKMMKVLMRESNIVIGVELA